MSLTNINVINDISRHNQFITEIGKGISQYIFIALALFVLPFSPLLSFTIGAIILVVYSANMSRSTRRFLGFLLALSGSLIVASREIGAFSSDDMVAYYSDFIAISKNGFDGVFRYGGGVEILLMLFYWLIWILFGVVNPASLAFLSAFLVSTLFLIWVERYGLKLVKPAHYCLCIAFSFTFFSFVNSTQIIRQMLSTVLLLLAVFENKRLLKYAFLALATLAHVSALPLFIVISLIFKKPRKYTLVFIILAIAIFSLGVGNILSVFSGWFAANDSYLRLMYYFSYHAGSSDGFAIYELIKLVVILVLGLLFSRKSVSREWLWFIFFAVFMYVALMNFPFMSNRFTMIISSVLFGYVFLLCVDNKPSVISIAMICYLGYKFMINGPLYAYDGMSFQLWHSFDWISGTPFYFLSAVL